MAERRTTFAKLTGEQWLGLLGARAERLRKFVALAEADRAPRFLVSREADLVRRALEAVEAIYGDRQTADAIIGARNEAQAS